MSFVGGRLNLKGAGVEKKKKKKAKKAKEGEADVPADTDAAEADDAAPDKARGPRQIIMTEAEKKHRAHMEQQQRERMKKTALKSHRERIQDFNEHLGSLTEHHDIPKVGPG